MSQFYDQHLAPTGLLTTQFSILVKLKYGGPLTINKLAEVIVMDRTALGRTILPLERDGLIAATQGAVDRPSKELRLTELGLERFNEAKKCWAKAKAQAGFEAAFGSRQDLDLAVSIRFVSLTPPEAISEALKGPFSSTLRLSAAFLPIWTRGVRGPARKLVRAWGRSILTDSNLYVTVAP